MRVFYPRDFRPKKGDDIKLCTTGIREFCIRYDVDFRDFSKNGVSEEVLRSKGDSIINKSLDIILARDK